MRMQALSRSISTNNTWEPHGIHHVHGHLDDGVRDQEAIKGIGAK